jgi:D-alanyl-D-alanine carboxypeptidase/D-alanyl-D-alanine-endopeptidase (penicillin-binding protein 4)
MRITLLIIIHTLILFVSSSPSQTISNHVQKLMQSDALKHGQWSVYAEFTDTGEKIVSLNPDLSMVPASGLKVFTSSCALKYLGEDFKFDTKIYYDGKISNDGTLNGNIYIAGGGDPTLGSSAVKGSLSLDSLMKVWVNAVKAFGIKTVEGAVIADDLLFDRNLLPDYYPWIDIGNYYGASTSALTINENLYYLYFKPGTKDREPAEVLRTEPEIPGLSFINNMKTGNAGSGDNGYIYCAPGLFIATLRGTIPAGVKEFSIKGSIPDPPLFAAQHFAKNLEQNGIAVTKGSLKIAEQKTYDKSKLIFTTQSPPLKDIIYILNKRSNNLFAEQLVKMLGYVRKGKGSTEEGLQVIKAFLEENNIQTEGLKLFDGSGLSHTNTITAKMMVKLLTKISQSSFFNSFYHSLGIAGDKEDISFYKSFGANSAAAKNARIKSGLITGARSHSGYVRNKSGRLIAFSMIANKFSGSSSQITKIHESLLIKLAETK